MNAPIEHFRREVGREDESKGNIARLEVYTMINIQVMVFMVVTPCSNVMGYHHVSKDPAASTFRMKMETAKCTSP